MQSKQTKEKGQKEEQVDSDSYFMPILLIPTKDERKLLQNSIPVQNNPQNKNKNYLQDKKEAQKGQESKTRGRRSKFKIEKTQDKDQNHNKANQADVSDKMSRENVKIDQNDKQQVSLINAQRQLRPRTQRKKPYVQQIQRRCQEMNLKEEEKPKQKTKAINKKRQPKQQSEVKKEIKIAVRVQADQSSQVHKTKQQNIDKSIKKSKEGKKQPSSDSSSSSSSSSGYRRRKTKKIKLQLTTLEKMQIWKNRYLRCRKKLKQNFYQCKRCPRFHFMRNLVHNPDQHANRLVCQKCHKVLEKNCLVYWQCDPCDYLFCGKCEGYNWKRCPFGHPIMRSEHFRGQKTCSICLNKKYVGGLTCSCKFEMCGDCQLRAKRYNQKGQEVISLQSQK